MVYNLGISIYKDKTKILLFSIDKKSRAIEIIFYTVVKKFIFKKSVLEQLTKLENDFQIIKTYILIDENISDISLIEQHFQTKVSSICSKYFAISKALQLVDEDQLHQVSFRLPDIKNGWLDFKHPKNIDLYGMILVAKNKISINDWFL